MPNWCVQNSILRGPKASMKRFCDIVNFLPGNPNNMDNDFGDFWLGNLFIAMGGKPEDVNNVDGLRGNLDPDGDQIACLFHPDPENKPFSPEDAGDDKAIIRFSVTTAWGPSPWFNDMIAEQFNDCEYGWTATDEFGNFHYVQNKELMGVKTYQISSEDGDAYFEKGEEDKAAEAMNEIINENGTLEGGPITTNDILNPGERLYEAIGKYLEDHYFEFIIWVE